MTQTAEVERSKEERANVISGAATLLTAVLMRLGLSIKEGTIAFRMAAMVAQDTIDGNGEPRPTEYYDHWVLMEIERVFGTKPEDTKIKVN